MQPSGWLKDFTNRLRLVSVFGLLTLSGLFIYPAQSSAGLILGGALSGAYDGRVVPGVSLGWQSEMLSLSLYSAGVRTSVYSHSSYQLGFHYVFRPGELLWGPITAGFGLGGYYARHQYRGSPGAGSKLDEDFVFGPSFRVTWNFLGPLFVGLETVMGLRAIFLHVFLNFQDMTQLSAGFQF